ncbi:MAG: Dihydropteroate synthase [Planctomycetota bacterium]
MGNSEASPPSVWRLAVRELTFVDGNGTRRPLVMGILNVTPDSFSDGGKHHVAERAIEAGLRMARDGADIIDIGGESTRPYSTPVDTDEELRRVIPVIRGLAGRVGVPISIDTSKAEVAREAIESGAEIINDVTGLDGDPEMAALAARTSVGVCVMHMRGTPQTMQDDPRYGCVVTEIEGYLIDRLNACVAKGIDPQRVCLDPGIGFGKTHAHNLELLRATRRFVALGRPILIGHSRKGFIGKVLGDGEADRDAGTVGVSLAVIAAGAAVVRVHAVRPNVDAIKLFIAAGGLDG